MRLAALGLLVAAACNGETGTLQLTLIEPASEHHLGSGACGDVTRLRVTLTNPRQAVDAACNASGGFDVSFDTSATSQTGQLVVQGFAGDATDAVIVGESPPVPLSALDANIAIYVAEPNSITVAPATLVTPRTDMAVVALAFGVASIGGKDDTGSSTESLEIYNAFTHTNTAMAPLLDSRFGVTAAVSASDDIFIYSGAVADAGTDSTPAETMWEFDPTQPPNGTYIVLTPQNDFGRVGQRALPLGDDQFVVSGTPVALLSATTGVMTGVDTAKVAGIEPTGAAVVASDGAVSAVFADAGDPGSGLVIFHGEDITLPTITGFDVARTDHAVIGVPGGEVAILGGEDMGSGSAGTPDPGVVTLDALTGDASSSVNLPVRLRAAVSSTQRFVVAVSGVADDSHACTAGDPCVPLTTADILDAATLMTVAGTPSTVIARTGATAIALPNDQIMILGGVDADGAPVGAIELFTPALATDF